MLAPVELQRDLVLVGGGHAHVIALRMLAMQPIAGLRISLISPSSHTPYSGMLPGLIAGHYSFEQSHIDLARLCQWARVRFIQGLVTGLNLQAQTLQLADRPDIGYDLLSLDIGSQPELASVAGAANEAVPVKPVAQFWHRWQLLKARLAQWSAAQPCRIAVVGGGAGSVELILAMAQQLDPAFAQLGLWCGGPEILSEYNGRARAAVTAAMADYGITLHCGQPVASVAEGELVLANGTRAGFDELFWCTGATAAPWVAASGMDCDERGFLLLRDSLQSLSEDAVFGAGDIGSQQQHPRPKAGVYAVQQGPVLAHNLRQYLLGGPLRLHKPQRGFLSLLSLGQRRATADRGPFSATGAWVWRWKDYIDRKFMARFQQLPVAMPATYQGALRELANVPAQAHCGGCGAKVAANSLAAVLANLHRAYPGHSLAPQSGDDTALIPVVNGVPNVQSIDVLRRLVADDWVMGQIAANHALSDLYACGARPVSALATVTLPFANSSLQGRDLEQLLSGVLAQLQLVDCQLAGGHSLQGPELNIGLVVNGAAMAADGRLLTKRGLRVGDALILTKALGTGTLFAAQMQLRADGRDLDAAQAMMLQSNFQAAGLALQFDASACTDVTGFGLLGHLLEMLAPAQGAELQLAQLPVLPGALASLGEGVYSTMHSANQSGGCALGYAGNSVGRVGASLGTTGESAAGCAAAVRRELLFDPQTSGGLLLGVAVQQAAALQAALVECGYAQAAIIGRVTDYGAGHRVTLR